MPQAASLAELNARLAEADAAEDARHIATGAATVGEDFAAEAPLLLPLPAEPFDTARGAVAAGGPLCADQRWASAGTRCRPG